MRKPVVLVLVLAAVAGAAVSVAAGARTVDFRDEFTSFDTSRWVVIGRTAGKGVVDSANVSTGAGHLRVRLPAGRLDGGEARTVAQYRYGTYRTRMRIASAPSSLTAFYLYGTPDYQREVDIELYNDSSGRVMFTTYSGGAQTNTRTTLLPFDASAGFHEYAIEYLPGSVRFVVDGVLVQQWTRGITRAAMNLFVTAWFPSWLEGQSPATDRYTEVDWIEFVGR